jgi:hypothetical protein
MKRFWKIALMVPFIMLSIGTYYINAANIKYLDYYLKFYAGDEKEASRVAIQANYTDQSLTIRSAGSEYHDKRSLWKLPFSSQNYMPKIEKLQKEYRHFMRGKYYPEYVVEDDKTLGYVDIDSNFDISKGYNDYRVRASIYNKKSKSSFSFETDVPQNRTFSSIRLIDMQMVGDFITLVTMNTKNNGNLKSAVTLTEIHLYKLDWNKKNITADQVILTGDSGNPDDSIEIRSVNETAPFNSNGYLVFQIIHSKKVSSEVASGFSATGNQELVYYDLQRNKLVTIQDEPINTLLKKTNELGITYAKDELVLTHLKDPNGTRVILYSLVENKIKSDLTIDTKHFQAEGKWEGLTSALTVNNRLYMRGNLKHGTLETAPSLVIADLDTGKILYEGYISRKDNKAILNLLTEDILVQ